MKNITSKFRQQVLTLCLIGCTTTAFATDLTINFTGSGASTTVGDVSVQNLTTGAVVTVTSGQALTVNNISTAIDFVTATKEDLKIYPQSDSESVLKFTSCRSGSCVVSLWTLDGKMLTTTSNELAEGENTYRFSIPKGICIARVEGNGYTYATKYNNATSASMFPFIALQSSEQKQFSSQKKSKSVTHAAISYSTGDVLLYKAISGNYTTIVTDTPTVSKAINFEFVPCTDAAGNNYAVVKVGNQTWMAENLKTAKYNNGDAITSGKTAAQWKVLATEACSAYGDDDTNIQTVGLLYNFYATTDARGIAPAGWHVPTDAEWTTLTTQMGGNLSGNHFRETGNVNWAIATVPSTNLSGFSVRAGGQRGDADGAYSSKTSSTILWTTTVSGTTPFTRMFYGSKNDIAKWNVSKKRGCSIRCIKD